VPVVVAVLMAAVWVATFFVDRTWWKKPLARAAVIGPLVGILVFYFRSPFPEVRFITPLVAVLIALAGATVCRMRSTWAIAAASVFAVASIATVEVPARAQEVAMLAVHSAVWTLAVVGLIRLCSILSPARRVLLVCTPVLLTACAAVFTWWAAYVSGGVEVMFVDGSAYSDQYPAEFPLWKFVSEKVPPDATVAYTNLYLVYPLMGPEQRRHLLYVPTRDGITTIASLPYLGDGLQGRPLVQAATAATIANPDPSGWLKRLDQSGAAYLVVGLGDGVTPPELESASKNPARFRPVFRSNNAAVFELLPQR
jgi:hypothetical protein